MTKIAKNRRWRRFKPVLHHIGVAPGNKHSVGYPVATTKGTCTVAGQNLALVDRDLYFC